MYDFAFAFWSFLSTDTAELPGGKALSHAEVPYLLSNAAWYPRPGELKSVAEWYAARDLPPALVAPALRAAKLENALRDGPFELERAFVFREAAAREAVREDEGQPERVRDVVEQVSWAQTRYAGELLAGFYEQPGLAVAVAKSLTEAMRHSADVQTFLAYRDEPVGTAVAFERENLLSAMLLLESGGLEARLVRDAEARGLTAFVLETLPEGVTFRSERSLERWSVR